jgi:hypothetical protein
MPQAVPPVFALDPAMPLLLRPDGAVQVGAGTPAGPCWYIHLPP